MKKLLLLLATLIVIIGCEDTARYTKTIEVRECPTVTVRFSPKGGVTQSIVDGIKASEHDIYVQAFSFTSVPIAEALVDAKRRGKTVEAVLDRENLRNKNSALNYLYTNGITIYIDDRHAIAHNKVLVVDKTFVFTGSFNLSKGAEEHNAENSITIHDVKVAELYFENWTLHKNHSYLYSPDN
jgi:phosphatidylserine/phosphatidylglycerophosphate/cardiolipin synthase-like enzyme